MPVSNATGRRAAIEQLDAERSYDVVVLGAGINGARIYDACCRQGYRALLLDRGDIASGTSQASGMMVWGGLLYLRRLDLATVHQLCRDRDRMIRDLPEEVRPQLYRLAIAGGWRSDLRLLKAGLWLYWAIGHARRTRPREEPSFDERSVLAQDWDGTSMLYEEAALADSDSRFVLGWVTRHRGPGRCALNYCEAAGDFDAQGQAWRLTVKDRLSGREYPVRAGLIVNCCGVWADALNAQFGIASPVRHAMSKGVYLALRRPESHRSPVIFDLGEHDDVITWVPWGPVSLWGPTETTVCSIEEGFAVTPEDVRFLLGQYNRRISRRAGVEDIVALRCGIRPLAVDRDFSSDCYPLEISRRQVVVGDDRRPWVSCYGGKITGSAAMAAEALRKIRRRVRPSGPRLPAASHPPVPPEFADFPGMPAPVPALKWCMEQELCCTLEDYLRRRTTISQWVVRQGLGAGSEHETEIRRLARGMAGGDEARADREYRDYLDGVRTGFDAVLAAV